MELSEEEQKALMDRMIPACVDVLRRVFGDCCSALERYHKSEGTDEDLARFRADILATGLPEASAERMCERVRARLRG